MDRTDFLVDKESANEIKRKELVFLAKSSGLPEAQWKQIDIIPPKEDLKEFQKLKAIKENIKEFVEQGKNLFISSKNVGNGKTSVAIKLMTTYFKEIWAGNGFEPRALFIHVPTLLFKLKDFNNPLSAEYIEQIKNIDLVVFDDIATQEKLTQFEYNQLLMLIDHRVLSKKSCIFTSNLTEVEQLSQTLGARLASRIYETSTVVEFKSLGKRGLK